MCAPSHKVVGYIFATKACIDNRKKFVKHQYLLHMSAQYGELPPTNGWDRLASLGHPSKFERFRVLTSVLYRRRSAEVNQTLQDVWPSSALVHFGGSCPLTEFSQVHAKFTLRPSFAFSYIGSVTARHSSSGRQPNFAAWYKEWNYGNSSFYCQCRSVTLCSVTSQLFCILATRYYLNPKTANNIATSFVRSKLDVCDSLC